MKAKSQCSLAFAVRGGDYFALSLIFDFVGHEFSESSHNRFLGNLLDGFSDIFETQR